MSRLTAPTVALGALPLVSALSLASALAPLQCPRPRPPEQAHEETPADALWLLAERFGAAGDARAREATLRFLLERYPSSRFAMRARDALATPADAPAAPSARHDAGR